VISALFPFAACAAETARPPVTALFDERMIMSGPELVYHNNGNGAQHHVPRSRKEFLRSAPGRIAVLEDQVEMLQTFTEDPQTAAIEVRLDNLVEVVVKLVEQVRIIDGRSARTRRRALALADQLSY
jgi:hypothetical protein